MKPVILPRKGINPPLPQDSLLERIFIVHRYLESSGLDAGEIILRRLSGGPQKVVKETVDVIVNEEVKHVDFGSRWFRHYCQEQEADDFRFFKRKTLELLHSNPRPGKLSHDLRQRAGYTAQELIWLENAKQQTYLDRSAENFRSNPQSDSSKFANPNCNDSF